MGTGILDTITFLEKHCALYLNGHLAQRSRTYDQFSYCSGALFMCSTSDEYIGIQFSTVRKRLFQTARSMAVRQVGTYDNKTSTNC